MITTTIEDFKKKAHGDLSSVWISASDEKGVEYHIGFVSNPLHVKIYGGEREVIEENKRQTYYEMFKPESSEVPSISKKLQKKIGGKIEPSKLSSTFAFDEYIIKNPEIQITPDGIDKCISGLGLNINEIKF